MQAKAHQREDGAGERRDLERAQGGKRGPGFRPDATEPFPSDAEKG